MNTERILALADLVEPLPHWDGDIYAKGLHFNMNHWANYTNYIEPERSCGTACCLAGLIAHEVQGRSLSDANTIPYTTLGAEWLEIDFDTACLLFTPPLPSYRAVTPRWAAAVLRHFAATGRVDWQIGREHALDLR